MQAPEDDFCWQNAPERESERERGRMKEGRKEERKKEDATGILKNEMLFFVSQSPDFYV
jgi:hypothetical protein